MWLQYKAFMVKFLWKINKTICFCRKYNRLIKNHKVDLDSYNDQKEALGPAMYNGPNPVLLGSSKDAPSAVAYMVEDLEKQYVFFLNFKFYQLTLNVVLFSGLQNVRNTVEEERITMMLILITLMKGIWSLIRN